MLGPLEARVDGAVVGLGGGKQRALMALLLLNANDVVSLDVLIDALWEGTPSRTAPAFVQNCVHRLRQKIGRETLETRAPGYRLRIDPDAIDARRFERLVREARSLPARERAAALREALELWRGSPLSDLAFWSFAQEPIRYLEEQRVNALQSRLEAELELGLHREVIAELNGLVREHPTHERLRWLQLLALHRADRRQDALAAYQEARLAIVDESGIEPGEELRALHRRILQDDPTLMPDGAGAVAVAEQQPALARKVVAVCIVELLVHEDLDVEAARGLVARGLASLEEIVIRHGGAVEQLLGEEAVAVFGLPAAHEDDLLRALRSVVELQDALGSLPVRASVETGEVLVGEAGRVLSGGALTTARRVKEAAADGEVLLGPSAAAQSAGAAWTEPSEGGARLVELVEGAPAIARRPDAPLVGRRAELEKLVLAVRESAAASSCRRVLVLGDPGIGKTRLAAELIRTLRDEAHILTGRCVPYAEGATYLPLNEVVAQLAGDEDAASVVHTLLDDEPDGEQAAARLLDALGGLAAVGSGDVFWATRRLFEAVARRLPLLIVLEDVHWAEPTFLDLIEYLVGWSTGAPIGIVCLARTELLDLRPGWAADALVLRPLGDDETAELLAAQPEALALDDDARAAVVTVSEGNPLFIEQLAAHALDDPVDAGRVPASLESLLASRLDGLPAAERAVLERAAIVGREFTRAAVDALSDAHDASAATALLALVRRRLVRPDATAMAEDAFLFDHALVWDAAYAAIAKSERARLHEQLARWLDVRGAPDEIVGHHLEQAVANGTAVGAETSVLAVEAGERLAEAGERLTWSMEHAAAIRLLRRARRLLPEDSPRRLRADCVLGFALKSSGNWQEAGEMLAGTERAARAAEDRKHELWARIEQLWSETVEGKMSAEEMTTVAEEAIVVSLETDDVLLLARARDALATLEARRGRLDAAQIAVRGADEAYEQYGLRGFRDTLLAMYLVEGPAPLEEAIEFCEARLAMADTPRWSEGYLLSTLADIRASRGELDAARQLVDRARSSLLEFDQAHAEQTMWAVIAASIAALAGDADRASQILGPALEYVRQRGDRIWQSYVSALSADVALLQGDVGAALTFAGAARELGAAGEPDLWGSLMWRSALARALLASGDGKAARKELELEIERWEGTDGLLNRGRLRLLLAEVLAALGRREQALEEAAESLRLLELKGATYFADQARELAGQLAGEGALS